MKSEAALKLKAQALELRIAILACCESAEEVKEWTADNLYLQQMEQKLLRMAEAGKVANV